MAKNDSRISGLTSAALILASVSIGLSVGIGFYKVALFALLFMMLGIELVPRIAKLLAREALTKKE